MKRPNGAKTKSTKTTAKTSKAAAKRSEDIMRYKRLLEDNEARLMSKTNAKGEQLTPDQIATLQDIVQKQRDKLSELTGA
jgi:flagellar biosynthesis chaperone FliJ